MTSTITKISMFAVCVAVFFGVFGYLSNTQFFINDASAWGSTCGSCGDGGGPDTPDPTPPGPDPDGPGDPDPIIPDCTLSASPTTINSGASSILTWTTVNAISASFNQGIGSVAVGNNITRSVSPTGTVTYTMTVTSAHGYTDTCSATITVNPVVVPTPVCTLSVAPETINQGSATVLTWTTTNAVTASIDQSIGSVATGTNITRNDSPSTSRTYTMTVTNSAGVTATCADNVIVVPPTPTDPACELFSNRNTINEGEVARLSWTATNAINDGYIDQGVGLINTSNTSDYRNVSPSVTRTYTLTVRNTAGVERTCFRTITVVPVSSTFTCANNVNFSASATSIRRGSTSRLNWSTTGVDSISFDQGITATSLSGSWDVSPSNTTTYTLRATKGSNTISCPVTVSVSTGGGGGGYVRPACELEVSATSVVAGGKVTLTWDTKNAEDIVLKDNHGVTYVDTDDMSTSKKRELLDDSKVVTVTKNTTYTLTATKDRRDKVCTVKVTVKNGAFELTQYRDQKPTAGISLVTVPYTGFEAGPALTLAFYILLVLWALYLAYFFVIRRNRVAGSAVRVSNVHINEEMDNLVAPLVASTVSTPIFATPSVAPALQTAPVGYDSVVVDDATLVENHAHASHILLSGDALRYFMSTTAKDDRISILDSIIAGAKANYPSEGGWVVVNEERMKALCTTCFATANAETFTPSTVAVSNSSLAEAIVTGNIVAAYQMIGNRPMISLADASADLDAMYRFKNGDKATVSAVLATADIEPAKLHEAISALTGALDGTYTNEAEAVKMAILKAVKAIHG